MTPDAAKQPECHSEAQANRRLRGGAAGCGTVASDWVTRASRSQPGRAASGRLSTLPMWPWRCTGERRKGGTTCVH